MDSVCTGSEVAANGLSSPVACEIFLYQGSNCFPCISKWIFNHCATREVLELKLFTLYYTSPWSLVLFKELSWEKVYEENYSSLFLAPVFKPQNVCFHDGYGWSGSLTKSQREEVSLVPWSNDRSGQTYFTRPWKAPSIITLCVWVSQSCPTLCDPMNCSPPVCSVHEVLQARILEWVAIPFSRGSSQPRDWTWVSCISCRFFTLWTIRKDCWISYEQIQK